MVIYEVNFQIAADIFDDYLRWLIIHVKKMLEFPGFIEAKYLKEYSIDEINPLQINFIHLTVQYFIDNKEHLRSYLQNDAPRMREEGLQLFPGKFTATRRIFEILE
jgi:hypothetical protein